MVRDTTWAASEPSPGNLHRQWIRLLWAHKLHLLQHSPALGQMHTQREQSLIELKLQGFISSNWGADRIPDRAVTATDQKGSPASHLVQPLDPLTATTPPIKVIVTSTPWGKMCVASKSKPALTPKILDTRSLLRDVLTWKHPFKTTIHNYSS